MAKAITMIERKVPTAEEQQAESLADVLKAISDNRKAILSVLDILKEMEAAGLLDILQGILKNRASLGSVGLEFINVAHIPTMAKNVIMLAQFLGRLDPKETEKLIGGLGSGLEQAMQQEGEPPSLFGLMGLVRDPNVRTSMSTALHFLRGMGEGLKRKEEERN